ncbi:MAG: TRAP transporter large permease [Candidatus Aerophobetes bacterium]|nr:TRAP transporter large permease [Candidatus Aerophobetes bacterium]
MILLAIVFGLTVLLGVPVAFCLGLTSVVFILVTHKISLMTLPTLMFGGIDSFCLMAIPLFITAGFLVQQAGILPRLVDFANALVGHLRGGLAHINIVASMLFAGVSGVALADTAAIGSMLIPPMIKEGYGKKFTAVVTASSSIVGPIIPPSVAMIIYAYVAGGTVSVAGLFLAGVIPGIILGLGMMALTYIFAIYRNFPLSGEKFSFLNVLKKAKSGMLGLMVPIIILGGILSGMFTPTEAGAVAVAYALFAGIFITRQLTLKKIISCFLEASKTSAVVFMMLATAKVVAWILTTYQVPAKLTALLMSITANPEIFLIITLFSLLLIGFVLEAVATMVMLVPCFAPVALAYGISPHHFGLLFVMIVQVALITPPVALGLFIVCRLAETTIEEVFTDIWPFLFLIFGIIILVALLPGLAMWLPGLFGYT